MDDTTGLIRTPSYNDSGLFTGSEVGNEAWYSGTGARFGNGVGVTWSSGVNSYDAKDAGVFRAAPKVVELTAGTPATAGAGLVRGQTFASLPGSPVAGMFATVTDSNTVTWGATIAGGGANTVLAFYNGANWTVAGK